MKRIIVALAFLGAACTESSTAPRAPGAVAPPRAEVVAADAPATMTTEYGPLDAGNGHTCALRANGSIVCWSYNPYGQMSIPSSERFTEVSAAYAATCGIHADGTVGCYGSDGSGQSSVIPGTYLHVSAGVWHTCGMRTDHTVVCWGGGRYRDLLTDEPYREFSAGNGTTCGIRYDYTLVCSDPTLATPPGTFVQVSAGDESFHCAIRSDRTLVCWGDNTYGQLNGIPSGTFRQVSVGRYSSCALRDDGRVLCWGFDLPDIGMTRAPEGTFVRVTMGGLHACAQRASGSIVCWGRNDVGQLNVPREFQNSAPVANAGVDRTVHLDGSRLTSVTLDASASTDDGPADALTFTWSESGTVLGSGATLAVPLGIGVHSITLTVSDGSLSSNDEVVVTVDDPTPPAVVAIVNGQLGNEGWYRSDVIVNFSVSDPESELTSGTCATGFVTTDNPDVSFGCLAASAGGTTIVSQSVKRDATAPVVTFNGATSYTVDQVVDIRCAALDATSGVASSSCAPIAGPAYGFPLGTNAFSASAEDHAGNTGSAGGAFTVSVTTASLCTLVRAWVPKEGIETSLCAKLSAAESALARGDLTARAGQLQAFVDEVNAQTGKAVPAERAPTLVAMARAL